MQCHPSQRCSTRACRTSRIPAGRASAGSKQVWIIFNHYIFVLCVSDQTATVQRAWFWGWAVGANTLRHPGKASRFRTLRQQRLQAPSCSLLWQSRLSTFQMCQQQKQVIPAAAPAGNQAPSSAGKPLQGALRGQIWRCPAL